MASRGTGWQAVAIVSIVCLQSQISGPARAADDPEAPPSIDASTQTGQERDYWSTGSARMSQELLRQLECLALNIYWRPGPSRCSVGSRSQP